MSKIVLLIARWADGVPGTQVCFELFCRLRAGFIARELCFDNATNPQSGHQAFRLVDAEGGGLPKCIVIVRQALPSISRLRAWRPHLQAAFNGATQQQFV